MNVEAEREAELCNDGFDEAEDAEKRKGWEDIEDGS
jgi:hypothetical protein